MARRTHYHARPRVRDVKLAHHGVVGGVRDGGPTRTPRR
jgi:hypothetical protein